MRKLLVALFCLLGFTGTMEAQRQTFPGGGGSSPDGRIYASLAPYNVVADARYAFDVAFTNGSGVITWSATDPLPQTTDVGKICFGTQYAGVSPTSFGALVAPAMAQGTITSVNVGAKQETCSTTWTAASGNGTFVVGSDQTVNMTAAVNAAFNQSTVAPCNSLVLPTGGIIVLNGLGNTTNCPKVGTVQGDRPLSVTGANMRNTVIIIPPNFNWSTSRGLGNAEFFGLDGVSVTNLSVHGMGGGGYTIPASTAIFYMGCDTVTHDTEAAFVDNNNANLVGYTSSNCGITAFNINDNGAGSVGFNMGSQGRVTTYESEFVDSAINEIVVPSGVIWEDHNSGAGASGCLGPVISVSGTADLWGTLDNSAACTSGNLDNIAVQSGGVVHLHSAGCRVMPAGSNSACLDVLSGGTASFLNSYFTSGTGASSIPFGCQPGATCIDLGGNAFTVGAGSLSPNCGLANVCSGLGNGNNVYGICTGVGTASSTLGLYGTGPNVTLTTCTSTTIGGGTVQNKAGKLLGLSVTATAAGVNASSGVVTVLINGAASTMTCTIGTGTTCRDIAHNPTVNIGDRVSIQFTTQAADTLAGIKASVWSW
jgi:hypothetical protein